MKVGDLVLVGPSYDGLPCVVIKMEARNETGILPDCVMLYVTGQDYKIPMNKKWIKIIAPS